MRLLGGKPGDRSLGLPGNLVGYMPQSTRLVIMIGIVKIVMVKRMMVNMVMMRPKSWLARKPRWIHAPVHQVRRHDDAPVHQVIDDDKGG